MLKKTILSPVLKKPNIQTRIMKMQKLAIHFQVLIFLSKVELFLVRKIQRNSIRPPQRICTSNKIARITLINNFTYCLIWVKLGLFYNFSITNSRPTRKYNAN